jgi:hypothetical protein
VDRCIVEERIALLRDAKNPVLARCLEDGLILDGNLLLAFGIV